MLRIAESARSDEAEPARLLGVKRTINHITSTWWWRDAYIRLQHLATWAIKGGEQGRTWTFIGASGHGQVL